MLIKVCADSIVIREGGGSIFLRERQRLGGHLENKGESPPTDSCPLLPHLSPQPPLVFSVSLECFSDAPCLVHLCCHVSLLSLSFWVSLSLYDLLPEGCLPTLLPPPINGEPLPMCPCVNWGYVCRHMCLLGHVCGHVCMSEVTHVSELVCASVYLSPGASMRTPDCWGLCMDTCQGSYAHRYA